MRVDENVKKKLENSTKLFFAVFHKIKYIF